MAKRDRSFPGVTVGALRAALLGLLCVRTATAQFEAEEFKWPVYYKQNELIKGQTNLLKILLTGTRAVMTPDGVFEVEQMHIEYRDPVGRTNFVAQAPRCTLNRTKNTASSASRLSLQGENGLLFVRGDGFFCNLTNMTLLLSNQVET